VRTFGELPPLATLPDLLAGPAPEPPPGRDGPDGRRSRLRRRPRAAT
jgi:hypothetical protein